MRVDRDKVIEAIKPLCPLGLRVYCTDGREVEIGIPPKARYRWHRLEKTLASFEWHRIEGLDSKGKVCGVWEDNSAGDDVTNIPELVTERAGEQAALLALLIKGQEMALRRYEEMTRTHYDAQRDLLGQAVELMRVYTARLAHVESRQLAAGDGAGDGLEAMIASALPEVLSEKSREQKMEAVMERVAKRVMPKIFSQPAAPTAAGNPQGESSSAGRSGTAGNGQSKPGK